MISIPGYILEEKLLSGSRSRVYRAQRQHDGQRFLLKTYTPELQAQRSRGLLQEEWNLGRALDLPWVLRYLSLEHVEQQHFLLIEPVEALPLPWAGICPDEARGPIPLLRLALVWLDLIEAFHRQHILLRCLNPEGFLYDSAAGRLYMLDLSQTSRLTEEHLTGLTPAESLESLHFLAPEQSGRLNTPVDYRADFYSFGAALYQLAAGVCPFESDDPLELIHAHIARNPQPPLQFNPWLTEPVSNLILKLLSKNAEDRYQGFQGLRADLETCLHQWDSHREISLPELGRFDATQEFKLPSKLYGRRSEILSLFTAFERINQGGLELLMVQGPTGVGKTALVSVLQKPLMREHGFFISGSYEVIQRNTPFGGLIEALRRLIPQLLSEPATRIEHWSHELQEGLGETLHVLLSVLPELRWLFDPDHTDLPTASGPLSTGQQRILQRALLALLRILARREHPLVIFMDNLHWADASTLDLLRQAATHQPPEALLFIGAYRDTEVDANHLLHLTLHEIEETGTTVQTLTLEPLGVEAITELVSDLLGVEPHIAGPLARVLNQKTHGNPYFLHELLKSLHERAYIRYDSRRRQWQWDLQAIEQLQLQDNVIELMATKIQRLSADTRQALMLASCIGLEFRLDRLAALLDQPSEATATLLREAVLEELVAVHDVTLYTSPETYGLVRYRFAHERVQQAAHSLLPTGELPFIHLSLGRAIETEPESDDQPTRIFDLAWHLNQARDWMLQEEWIQLARVNLEAGRQALAARAFEDAAYFIRHAREVLHPPDWETHYDLAYEVYLTSLHTAVRQADFTLLRSLAQTLLSRLRGKLDAIPVYELLIQTAWAENNVPECLSYALEGLQLLDFHIPSEPGQLELLRQQQLTRLALLAKSPSRLAQAPAHELPPRIEAALRLMVRLALLVGTAHRNLSAVLACRMMTLIAQYGTPRGRFGAMAFLVYAVYQIQQGGQPDSAREWCEVGLRCLDPETVSLPDTELDPRIFHLSWLGHWFLPLLETWHQLRTLHLRAVEIGQGEAAARAGLETLIHGLHAGVSLAELEQEGTELLHTLERSQQVRFLGMTRRVLFTLAALRHHPDHVPARFRHEDPAASPTPASDPELAGLEYSLALMLRSIWNDSPNPADDVPFTASPQIHPASILLSGNTFYEVLIQYRQQQQTAGPEKRQWTRLLKQGMRRMVGWSRHCEANQQHRLLLFKALMLADKQRDAQADTHFRQAAAHAETHHLTHEHALILEIHGQYLIQLHRTAEASEVLQQAYHTWRMWGTEARAAALKARYPDRIVADPASATVMGNAPPSSAPPPEQEHIESPPAEAAGMEVATPRYAWMDFRSVMKASQSLSEQIHLQGLLENMLRILMENAGAGRGVLVLQREGKFFLKADGWAHRPDIAYYEHEPLDQDSGNQVPPVPLSVINVVARSHQSIVLNNAMAEGDFTNDPYIEAVQPRSVLCLPIVHQGKLLGMLYLENMLTHGAFTTDRVEVLQLLAAQAAISIDNANFYEELEQKVEQRTRDLNQALENLKATQDQLVLSEKMAALGQLVAGVAHEINNPLGVIKGAGNNLNQALISVVQALPVMLGGLEPGAQELFLRLLGYGLQARPAVLTSRESRQYRRAISAWLRELQVADDSYLANLLIQAGMYDRETLEPFAALFRLPQVTDIIELVTQLSQIRSNLGNIELATGKMQKIVFALKNYAHQQQQQEPVPVNLAENIDVVLTLYNNQLKHNIELVKVYPPNLPALTGFPDELNQVWTNLIHNALQAMEFQGRLEIRIDSLPEALTVQVIDSGKGIPPEVMQRMFEPFYTTKAAGEGSGLGLHICRRIVEKHGGQLSATSEPGRTVFSVSLPVAPPFASDTGTKDAASVAGD